MERAGAGSVIRLPVDRRLGLLVGEFRGRAHHDAMKGVAALAPIRADDHSDRERRSRLVRAEGAEIVGNPFRQHRNNPIREIHRIPTLLSLPIESSPGTHVGGDVRDRHRRDKTALVVRVLVRDRVDSVVMVLGIGGVDGDQRADRANPPGPRVSPARPRSASAWTSGENVLGMLCV